MRRIILFTGLGLATYLVALVATIPARVIVTPATGLAGVTGTVWEGEAMLAGGNRVAWGWAPLRTLANLAFAVDWTATGPATDLGGQALLRNEAMVLNAVAGRMDGALLRAFAPEMRVDCAVTMQVELARLAIGGGAQGAVGEIRSEAGTCAVPGLPALPVPPMIASAVRDGTADTRLALAPLGQRRNVLAAGTFDGEGRVRMALTPAGTAALPFLATGGITSFEADF